MQVVDCRRILKWTYAYGYYRFGEQAVSRNGAAVPAENLKQQQEFFEFNQVLPAFMSETPMMHPVHVLSKIFILKFIASMT